MRARLRKLVMTTMTLLSSVTFADVSLSDIQVFSGYPWKEVVVGYTIMGTADETSYVRLTATDKDANKTYIAQTLIDANVTVGRHIMRWNAAADGVKFASTNVVFTMAAVAVGVQLWENGPYWAECNLGASKPEEYGYYFWWGDTIGYKRNTGNNGWVSVKDGSSFSFSGCPTCDKSFSELNSAGYVDSTGNLAGAHDAATAHLGAPWRMPTDADFSALISNCTTTWTVKNGVYGTLVTGKGAYTSKSIFLPAAGYGIDSVITGLNAGLNYDKRPLGYYWSSSLDSDSYYNGLYLYIDRNDFFKCYEGDRCYGRPIRPLHGFAQ